ncbi:MAG: Fe(3+) ABC transporter substrate-binding protein [Thiotrichaceae bacterium]|nr:Fe(3+) ABC transporter substrate-binding protein [Thiotrichaceae bacterium]
MFPFTYKPLLLGVLCLSFLIPSACSEKQEELNLYSARKEKLIKPLLDEFTKKTNIKVNLVTGKADALLKRLQVEGKNSPADIFITSDAGRLYRAQQAGVLQSIQSSILNKAIPSHLREPNGFWYGLSQRARPIFYVKDRVNPKELSTYEDLANPKWQGQICIRSSSNIYNQSLVASMLENNKKEVVEKWAKGLVANFAKPPKGGDRDQIAAAAAGQCDIAIANTYYFGKMLNAKKDPQQQKFAEAMAIFWPNQLGRGTHVNVSGIAVTKAAKNKNNAIKLIEFLVSPKSQQWYAESNHEYPVITDVEWSEDLKSWGKFKTDTLNLSKLGELNTEAVKLMDRAGWK